MVGQFTCHYSKIRRVSKEIVTLVTCSDFPNLEPDEAALPDALRERGLEPRIAVWDDPDVDWSDSTITVLRSVRDYALKRERFLQWAHTVPRLLNQASLLDWNSDKHYLRDLAQLGLPTIPTTWLEPEQNLNKMQIHTRFPADGDFIIKPAVSSGGRGIGRYTASDPSSRADAIEHAREELAAGHSIMVQRYFEQIDTSGETSLVYLNGLASYRVDKAPMLHERFRSTDHTMPEEVSNARAATEEEWRWGEHIRRYLHAYIKQKTGRDELLLFNRVDIVRGAEGDPNEFYVMEISLIDGSLYLSHSEDHLEKFADAIAVRARW